MAALILSIVQPASSAGARPGKAGAAEGVAHRPDGAVPAERAWREHEGPEHTWQGASGRGYRHRVYGLIECPPLPPAGYVLVRRDTDGRRTPLRIGIAASDAPTLNLAEIRRYGAQAGANEVHVRLDDASEAERRLVACDLRAGLLGTLSAAEGSVPVPEA